MKETNKNQLFSNIDKNMSQESFKIDGTGGEIFEEG